MDSYRSILLGCSLAKHHHAWLRARAVTCLGHLISCTQKGGMPARCVDLASLTLHTQLAAYRYQGRSVLALFADIKSANYRALRQLILPADVTIRPQASVMPLLARR